MRKLINLIEDMQTDIWYRSLPADQVEDFLADRISHVGQEWTRDLASISDSGAILQARHIDSGEDQPTVTLPEDTPIFVSSILLNGQWDMIGKTFLT